MYRASRYHPADAPTRATSAVPLRASHVTGSCPVTRILGIDLGSKRIGLAIADRGIGIARPLATIGRGAAMDEDVAALARVCREQAVSEIVIGLPIEASGTEGPMAEGARAWATAVGAGLAIPVVLRDERLSSFEAERRMGRMPRGRSGGPPSRTQRNAYRARIDREAASVILQDELDARRDAGAPVAVPAAGNAGSDGQEDG